MWYSDKAIDQPVRVHMIILSKHIEYRWKQFMWHPKQLVIDLGPANRPISIVAINFYSLVVFRKEEQLRKIGWPVPNVLK